MLMKKVSVASIGLPFANKFMKNKSCDIKDTLKDTHLTSFLLFVFDTFVFFGSSMSIVSRAGILFIVAENVKTQFLILNS